jgi:hypothetical protein
MTIEELAKEALELYRRREIQRLGEVIKGVIPILYFGDYKTYQKSKLKIITIGLNPSLAEFPHKSFSRFPKAKSPASASAWADRTDAASIDRYLDSLNAYFTHEADPYMKWFKTFCPLLEGLGAGFKPGRDNTALHTDLCTPIATNPTWGPLNQNSRDVLKEPGNALWHKLINTLKPDILLFSSAKSYLKDIEFSLRKNWKTIHKIPFKDDGTPRKIPYTIQQLIYDVAGKNCHLLYGSPANVTPFSGISDAEKLCTGKIIKETIAAYNNGTSR